MCIKRLDDLSFLLGLVIILFALLISTTTSHLQLHLRISNAYKLAVFFHNIHNIHSKLLSFSLQINLTHIYTASPHINIHTQTPNLHPPHYQDAICQRSAHPA